jgi:hypothetical protein
MSIVTKFSTVICHIFDIPTRGLNFGKIGKLFTPFVMSMKLSIVGQKIVTVFCQLSL